MNRASEPRRRLPAGRHPTPPSGHLLFLREFVRAPLRTASVVPSSRFLAERMISPLHARDWSQRPPVVLELGPGTGAFTRVVQQAAPAGTRHLGVELNPVMAQHLSDAFPGVEVVVGAAADLPDMLDARGIDGADLIISGLPWQSFAGPAGPRLVDTIAGCLAVGGTYTQFTYSWTKWAPPAKRQHRTLHESFDEVQVSRTIWRNLPPAFVYTSSRPSPADRDGDR
jgi:phospholipid N-methyltransferase